jgi:hypothetical protein
MRKFKLLKDLPWAKAGKVFEEENECICINEDQQHDWVFLRTKHYPEWFKEIKE